MGRKKISYDYVRLQFEKRGFQLLSQEYNGCDEKLQYQCDEGHINEIRYRQLINSGIRCLDCNGYKRQNINFVRDQFKKANYKLISKEYLNVDKKLEYKCDHGHINVMSYMDFKMGHRCPDCLYESRKYHYDEVKKSFEQINYKLISKEYIDCKKKLDYICDNGHRNSITYDAFMVGKRCPDCANNKKYDIDFIRKKFKERGYILLSNKYTATQDNNLTYVCPHGHVGTTSYFIFQSGSGCFDCAHIEIGKKSSGINSYFWNPNLTEEERNDRIESRISWNNKKWCNNVKERDLNTCQCCGLIKSGNIEFNSHHIFNFSNNKNIRYDVLNGITLCKKCHVMFHSMFGIKNNNVYQIYYFIFKSKIKFKKYTRKKEKLVLFHIKLKDHINEKIKIGA